ncbi:ABC-type spermidine/putrescine transport system, permease component II [Cupriavidus necator]|uniref:ABC transporter permease subunit n=1 Tax=Cupriavidus necator (strain ATCC 17699 / DSM 428 / KCTC 22496 / NCIMB 10442 / H16 / Stanier 337) TaxID=381666 RepID=Q0K062_CUPNH|nr:ABC transporter permease subunit [Cupriavidus necator]QCC04436.1 ABC transporter permease subunit [Cupriavidus necator H16]QQB79126.1 ABC transporter permease subunit [Cupriavidus necator]WKA43345.1 ABC transporter permease subunit [Cupriavidus necator]CAJ96612.1 ABC-type transporter, duplicated permease domains [Cupriavidus necator H16]
MTAVALQRRPLPWLRPALLAAPLVLLFVVLLVYPVGQLLLLSVYSDGAFTLAKYRQLFASSVYVDVMLITLKISLWTTLLSVVAGYPVAYLISSLSKDRKAKWLFWVLLSFWTSFLVRAFAWIVMLGRNGVVNQLLSAAGIQDAPSNLLYSLGAVLVAMVHALMPLAVLTMLSVMENIDRNLPRAALTLGARPGTAFWRVYFPLSMPGVAAGAIMVFVTAVGFFIVPALLGGRKEIMVAQLIIDQVQQTMNWGFAGSISVLLLLVVLAVFALYDKVLGLSSMAGGAEQRTRSAAAHDGVLHRLGDSVLGALGAVSDKLLALVPRGRREPQPGDSLPLRTIVLMVLLFLSVPALLMIPLSFADKSGLNWPPRGFTLQHYQDMLASPLWMQAGLRSLLVGLGAAVLALLVGTPVAFLLARSQMRGKSLLLAFVLSPIIIPRMIIAVGMFYFFARVGLVGTSLGLMIGHTVIAVPYVVMTMMAVLRNYDTRLDLAAQSLGARPWQTLRYVTLPILAAGLFSSFLFAFATSFDELTIALFASGGLSATLPKQFWDEVTLQLSPVIAAVSTCLFVFVTLLITCAERLRRKSAGR